MSISEHEVENKNEVHILGGKLCELDKHKSRAYDLAKMEVH